MSARVHISLFNLIVEVESDFKYPDQMQDMDKETAADLLDPNGTQTVKVSISQETAAKPE